MTRIHARTIVPDEMAMQDTPRRDSGYTPWVIGHTDYNALENGPLDEMWRQFQAELTTEVPEDMPDDRFEEFLEFLLKHEYVLFPVYSIGTWYPKENA